MAVVFDCKLHGSLLLSKPSASPPVSVAGKESLDQFGVNRPHFSRRPLARHIWAPGPGRPLTYHCLEAVQLQLQSVCKRPLHIYIFHIFVNIYIYIYLYIYMFEYINKYVHIYNMYIYIYMYVYMYMYKENVYLVSFNDRTHASRARNIHTFCILAKYLLKQRWVWLWPPQPSKQAILPFPFKFCPSHLGFSREDGVVSRAAKDNRGAMRETDSSKCTRG